MYLIGCDVKVVSYSDLRKNLASLLDSVIDDHAPVFVTRQNNQTAVLISLEDFNAYEETAHLLRTPANAERLKRSIEQVEAGNIIGRELIEE